MNLNKPNIPTFKSHSKNREVPESYGTKLAKDWEVKYVETSAATGANVEYAFKSALKALYRKKKIDMSGCGTGLKGQLEGASIVEEFGRIFW